MFYDGGKMVLLEKGRVAITAGKQYPLFDLWYKKDYYNIVCGFAVFGLYLCLEYVHYNIK